MKQVAEIIKQIIQTESEIKKLQSEAVQLRSAAFGSESVDENLATKFYREIGETSSELETQKETLQQTEKSLEERKAKLDDLKKDAYKKLADVKFPLKTGSEGIQMKNGTVTFLFDREIDNGVLQKVEKLLGIELSSGNINILSNQIELKEVTSLPEAMKQVIEQVERMRKAAMNQLKIDDYVKELRTRDEKIQMMLYVLYEAGKPLSRKDMETKAGLEPASLRGVLYVVEKRDPYLKKLDRGKFELTPLGRNVMEKYKKKYGSPSLKEDDSLAKTEKTLQNYTANSNETLEK